MDFFEYNRPISLAHHGIKGQKWGVKNGPPYPLDKNKRNMYEGNSGNLGDIDPLVLYVTTAVLATVGQRLAAKVSKEINYKSNKEAYDSLIDKSTDIKYSDIAHYSNDNHDGGSVDKKNGLPIKQTITDEEEDMKLVNPEYRSYAYASVNCGLCTAAYDIRRRGYDVKAGYSDNGINPGNFKKWYPDSQRFDWSGSYGRSSAGIGKKIPYGEIARAMTSVTKDTESRGALFTMWAGTSSGHAMAYEVNKNGDFIIRDCQTNHSYKGNEAMNILRKASYIGTVRLDNVIPDYDVLKKDGVIR